MSSIYEFKVHDINGQETELATLQGKVLLIVNTASHCGYTPQYQGLEQLYQQYREQGLVVLGFPCNQFGKQEPGSSEEIQQFCELNFGVSFPLYAKVEVNGPNTAPLFAYLKNEARGILGTRKIKWNFTKFLVGRDGNVMKRFAPRDRPERLVSYIEDALSSKVPH
ncbi:MAG: glutathione peroxidase [Gammaproteobacteria bacterium]|nr:glutathione peroxidase [Gammaproteobacteria bacterium]